MAVCLVCKTVGPHKGKPENCAGGTWCDCQHRLPNPMNEPTTKTTKVMIDTEEGKNV